MSSASAEPYIPDSASASGFHLGSSCSLCCIIGGLTRGKLNRRTHEHSTTFHRHDLDDVSL